MRRSREYVTAIRHTLTNKRGDHDCPMKDVARLILSHFDGIVAWTKTRHAHGRFEALDGLFQTAKRKARGYGEFEAIRTVIFLLIGKLDFSGVNPYVGLST